MPRSKQAKESTTIPSTIRRSDKRAQHLWKKAHDSAVKTYGEGGRAHRVAYAALKHEYKKEGDKWAPKGWKGPSDPQAAQGAGDKPKPTRRAVRWRAPRRRRGARPNGRAKSMRRVTAARGARRRLGRNRRSGRSNRSSWRTWVNGGA